MCLSEIHNKFDPPLPEEGVGFKVVQSSVGVATTFFCNVKYIVFPPDKWVVDAPTRQHLWDEDVTRQYDIGFHIFTKEEDALRYKYKCYGFTNLKVVKVKYRKVTTIGIQGGDAVVVAKEIKVCA